MKIIVNNQSTETKAGNLAELAQELNLPERGVAMAVNNKMVPKDGWRDCKFAENDSVTIIKAVFGG